MQTAPWLGFHSAFSLPHFAERGAWPHVGARLTKGALREKGQESAQHHCAKSFHAASATNEQPTITKLAFVSSSDLSCFVRYNERRRVPSRG
jgi:hypothetical protein